MCCGRWAGEGAAGAEAWSCGYPVGCRDYEKNLFLPYTMDLGSPIPETHTVTSRAEVHRLLSQRAVSPQKGEKKKYILNPVAIDDLTRMDLTPLPRRTLSETYHQVARTPISASNSWLLQQFIRGKGYCTDTLVVYGVIKSFVACPDLVMNYESIAHKSPLNKSMLLFTKEFVARASLERELHCARLCQG